MNGGGAIKHHLARVFILALCCAWASPALAENAYATVEQPAPPADVTTAPQPTAAIQPPDPAGPPPQASAWQFSSKTYLWLAGMKGDVGVVEEVEPVRVDISFDIVDALKFAVMGIFEARHDRFVASTEAMYSAPQKREGPDGRRREVP